MNDYGSLVIVTVAVAAGGAEIGRIAKKEPPKISPVIGGFVLGLFLFAFGAINQQIGSGFCYLIIVTALLINGAAIFKTVK